MHCLLPLRAPRRHASVEPLISNARSAAANSCLSLNGTQKGIQRMKALLRKYQQEGNSLTMSGHSSEEQRYTPKVFSALTSQVPQQAKRGLVYIKKLVFNGKEEKNICTPKKEPSRCLWGTSSHSIGVLGCIRRVLEIAFDKVLRRVLRIRMRLTTTRDRNLQFRGADWIFEFSPVVVFFCSPGLLCNLVRRSPQNVEKIARFPGGEKSVESCHVSGCHGFFGPDRRCLAVGFRGRKVSGKGS